MAHRRLALYFESQESWFEGEGESRIPNYRKLSELPYHQTNGELWDGGCRTLTDLQLLEAKAEAGMVLDLAMDFTRTNGVFPSDRPWARNLRLLEQALRSDLNFLSRHPTTLFQCLWNSGWWYDCLEAAKHHDPPEGGWGPSGAPWERREPRLCKLLQRWRDEKQSREPDFVWLRSLRPPLFPLGGAQLACLRAHCATALRRSSRTPLRASPPPGSPLPFFTSPPTRRAASGRAAAATTWPSSRLRGRPRHMRHEPLPQPACGTSAQAMPRTTGTTT